MRYNVEVKSKWSTIHWEIDAPDHNSADKVRQMLEDREREFHTTSDVTSTVRAKLPVVWVDEEGDVKMRTLDNPLVIGSVLR